MPSAQPVAPEWEAEITTAISVASMSNNSIIMEISFEQVGLLLLALLCCDFASFLWAISFALLYEVTKIRGDLI